MWPFKDDSTGAKIYKTRFYGFGDSGFLAGDFAGYDLREQAVTAIQAIFDGLEIGTKPEHLGEYGVTVLSGEEYVNRLKYICGCGILGNNDISEYGSWSEPPTKVYTRDMCYAGAYVVLANSYEEALELMKVRNRKYRDMGLEEFKTHFEEEDIHNGMVVETVGDF